MIRLFDLGMATGSITDLFVDRLGALGIKYMVYGFEPQKKMYNSLVEKYKNNPKINIINAAVSNFEGRTKLYKATAMNGNSICETKYNITREFEDCDVVMFSKWFNSLGSTPNDINIVICDIEGSEYEFYTDIIDSGVSKEINTFCGSLGDIHKLGKPLTQVTAFLMYLQENNIVVNEINANKTKNLLPIIRQINKEYNEPLKATRDAHREVAKETPKIEIEPEVNWFGEKVVETVENAMQTLDKEIVEAVKKKRIKKGKKKDVDKN
jgi:FkbM family methyltransferase